MQKRGKDLLRGCLLLLAVGLGYAWLSTATGWAVPCPVRTATGLLCPGCGVTRMCLALLRGDLAAAWTVNPGLMLALPLLGVLGVRLCAVYVRTGRRLPRGWEQAALWALVVWLVGWGVVRNLWAA